MKTKIDGMPHDRGEPDRALHVVAEDQEAGAERAEAAQREAVDDRAHAVLADAEVQVAPAVRRRARRRRRRRSASASTARGRPSRRPARAALAAAHWMTSWEALRVAIMPASGPLLGRSAPQPSGSRGARMRSSSAAASGWSRREASKRLAPTRPAARAPRSTALAEVLERLVGDEERLQARLAVDLLGEPDLLLAERRAVRAVRVLLVRRAGRDVGADDDQAGRSSTSCAARTASSSRSRPMSSPRFWTCQP